MATQTWAEGAWIGKWHTEQQEAWMKQIFEVQTWRKVRGLAGAVLCETRDGHKMTTAASLDFWKGK